MDESNDRPVRTGGCLCGGVRYRLTGPLRPVVNCHCGQCLRFHGHHGAYTTLPPAAFTLVADGTLRWYESSDFARRGFCATCGSSLFWQRKDGKDGISVAAGTLDQPTGLATLGDIFVADKADYYTIEPGRPAQPQGGADQLAEGS
ncbi:MAG: GFA family protein [Alphaproteobacteria bacterium]